MATLLSRVEHKLSRTLRGQASRALSSQRKSVSHSDWWTLGQGHLARPRSLVSRSRAAVPVLTPRRSINLVVGGTHILDTPTQHTVYHRGNHKVIDVTNAVIEGDKEDIHREAWRLVNAMADAARAAGANVLMTEVKVFDGKATTSTGAISPPGFASVVLLDESHLSAHCYAKTGLLAIDCFTCGSDPDATDQIVLKVEKLVREMFPAASLEIQSMRRFGHFDIPRYIEEYYCSLGEEPLGVDNQNLLKFHHRAWKKVNERTGGKKVSVLELGGGPTIYQLLSASRYAGSVYFTDLLQTNVDYVRQYKTGQQATDWCAPARVHLFAGAPSRPRRGLPAGQSFATAGARPPPPPPPRGMQGATRDPLPRAPHRSLLLTRWRHVAGRCTTGRRSASSCRTSRPRTAWSPRRRTRWRA